jgi:hypothetical protein
MRDATARGFAWLQGEPERIRSGMVAEAPPIAPQFHADAAQAFARELDAPWESSVRRSLHRSSGAGRHHG